jgi:hypothetical protein
MTAAENEQVVYEGGGRIAAFGIGVKEVDGIINFVSAEQDP